MSESFKKVYPILLPILCIAAGIISIIFFFYGPIAKGNYDVLAIGCVASLLGTLAAIILIVEAIKGKGTKK